MEKKNIFLFKVLISFNVGIFFYEVQIIFVISKIFFFKVVVDIGFKRILISLTENDLKYCDRHAFYERFFYKDGVIPCFACRALVTQPPLF